MLEHVTTGIVRVRVYMAGVPKRSCPASNPGHLPGSQVLYPLRYAPRPRVIIFEFLDLDIIISSALLRAKLVLAKKPTKPI